VLQNPSKAQPEDGIMKKAETCRYYDFLNYFLIIFYIITFELYCEIICILLFINSWLYGVILLYCYIVIFSDKQWGKTQVLVTNDSRNVARTQFMLVFQAAGFLTATLSGIWIDYIGSECFIARYLVVFCGFQ
jgi:hypothetical protein